MPIKLSKEMKPKISIVIGTYNLLAKLKLVLDSFNNQNFDLALTELIIVDSSSSDGTIDFFENKKYNFNFKFITQKNKGKAAARNRGIKEARADLIMITDADMIAHPDLVKSHYELQEENDFDIIVEGKTWVLNSENLPVENYLRRPYITHKVKHKQKLDFYYCLTGNLSMPKTYFVDNDYFDEEYQSYGWEDVDLGYRLIRKQKKKILYSDLAQNYHFHVWSSYQEIERRFDMGKSVHRFIKKFPELKQFLGINSVNHFIYRIFSRKEKTIQRWMAVLLSEKHLSKIKKTILREYYYYKGYRSI